MPEQGPERNRYESPRDEALYYMAVFAWANRSGGSIDSPIGWFARISNEPEDLHEIQGAFGMELASMGVEAREVIGHFVLREIGPIVDVEQFATERGAIVSFAALETVYREWSQMQ